MHIDKTTIRGVSGGIALKPAKRNNALVLTELLVVIVLISLMAVMAVMNMLGVIGTSEFERQTAEFIEESVTN